jgi:hypothetical protein
MIKYRHDSFRVMSVYYGTYRYTVVRMEKHVYFNYFCHLYATIYSSLNIFKYFAFLLLMTFVCWKDQYTWKCIYKSITRSYYRKESAASPPRDQRHICSVHNLLNKAGFPLGEILRAERNFSLSFLIIVPPEKSQDKEKFRSARKIPPNGKPA